MIKRIFIVAAFLLVSTFTINAQDIAPHALGLRLGDSDGVWAEVSYQAGLSSDTRIEIDLGIRSRNSFSAVKLTGIYQWVFNIDGGLNWYVGPGIGGGLIDYDNGDDGLESFGFIAGDVGIEYSFDFPLLISLDFRPEIYFDDFGDDDLNFNVGVSARYQF
ncbi:hypothetical protein GCM10022393_26380 [Aquimarina addita]|uniref:Outer membrane protein beta-barrel domain-containing protein n=1 Tax=Aquimarina addita TaxID=870485 RepID=A0ABP6ULM6_9FLAO